MCGQILWGLFRQGLQCEVCGVNCHRRCKAAMPNLCGVNQKLLAEALLDIKSQKNSKSKDSSTNAVINVTKTGAFEERRANMPLPEPPAINPAQMVCFNPKLIIPENFKCTVQTMYISRKSQCRNWLILSIRHLIWINQSFSLP